MYTKIITLMKVCQSCFLTPPNSPFFIKIFFMFESKPMGNLILWMTSFTSLLCFSVNNHGRLFRSSNPSYLFEYRITLRIAWLASWMSVQILKFFLFPSYHLWFAITFQSHSSWYALYQTNELFLPHIRETSWIEWDIISFLVEAHY